MLITLQIENVYADGDSTRETLYDVKVPKAPTDPDEHEEWAEDNLFPLTGTGRYAGNGTDETTPDAAYFVEVLAAEDPALVGRKYEWGL